MAKKGRHRQGGRVTPKGTRPEGFRPRGAGGFEDPYEPEPDLMRDARVALGQPHPLDFLALVSGLLHVVDPRNEDPFRRHESDDDSDLVRAELLHTFLEVDRRETTALLTAIRTLSGDEVEQRRITAELADRHHSLPDWLTTIDRAEAYWTAEVSDVLGDANNVFVAVRLPTGHELTAIVLIDHNLGTITKDGFVVAGSGPVIIPRIHAKHDITDETLTEIAPADARARIADAIESDARTYPPTETDTWPHARPLVEWMISLLPDGGTGYERREWTEDERTRLVERFLASPFAPPTDPDQADLADTIVWYGCDYGVGDPLRWSPVRVEILLADWIPRKIIAPLDYLEKAPAVLRAFVRFAHAESGIEDRLTDETLAAIDDWEPDYQELIRTPRPQGPNALVAAMGVPAPNSLASSAAFMLCQLARAVGGGDGLAALDDVPLPDEPFDWDGIDAHVAARVREVLALTDGCCDAMFDVEHRTACRRVLARIARNAPLAVARGRAGTAAAAICWSVARANESFPSSGSPSVRDLLDHFETKNSPSERARTLLTEAGFELDPHDYALGSADYLVSSERRSMLDSREQYEEWLTAEL